MNNKLYVGNLSFQTTDRDLSDHFSGAGTVQEATVISDRVTGNSRGFGFVVMASEAEAEAAIQQFNNRDFQGRSLTVNIAREREQRPDRGSRGDNRRPARRF